MLRLLFACLLATALAACGSVPTGRLTAGAPKARISARAASSEDFYPSSLGRTWRYQTFQTQGDNPERPGKDQRFEISQLVPEGAVMRRFYGDFEAPPTLIRKSPAGVVLSRYTAGGPPATDSIAILRYPLQIGASWPGRTFPAASESIEVAGTESVTVPAGTYEVWHIRHVLTYAPGGGDDLDYWYCAGVGMVQAVERVTLQAGSRTLHMQVRALLAETQADTGPEPEGTRVRQQSQAAK